MIAHALLLSMLTVDTLPGLSASPFAAGFGVSWEVGGVGACPANVPHALEATARTKMLLVMLRAPGA